MKGQRLYKGRGFLQILIRINPSAVGGAILGKAKTMICSHTHSWQKGFKNLVAS